MVSTAQAGDSSAAADAALIASKMFKDATEYKRLNAFEIGGDQTRAEACPGGEGDSAHNLVPPDVICRALYRVKKTFCLWHPPRYQVTVKFGQRLEPWITDVKLLGATER